MTNDLREIEESIALALADTYAGEPFRDSTFEQGTAAVMAIVGPIVAARDEAMRQRQEASDRFIDHYNGTAGHLDRIGQLESALRERTGERDEAKGQVDMHMGHRLQIEAMLDEIIGIEPIEGVDGFVANVAYALRKLQDERSAGAPPEDDADHVIEFRETGWTIKHPLSCRPSLFNCPVSRAAEVQLDEPPKALGRFVVSLTNDGLLRVGDPA